MPTVSVIMGIYNCEKTLSTAIDSIINQTYTDWELIMCDDGSTDNTYKIAKIYQKKYSEKIILLKNHNNMGLAKTLNKCITYSSGEYIARMDADDISVRDRFEVQVKFLDNNKSYDVVGSRIFVFNDEGIIGIRGAEGVKDCMCMKRGVPFAHPSIMMRKKAYLEINGYSVKKGITRCEDLDLWFKFFSKGFKGYNLEQPLLNYRESINDYEKRKVKYGLETTITYIKGYRLLKYPIFYYIFTLKPLISSLLPNWIMFKYHQIQMQKLS